MTPILEVAIGLALVFVVVSIIVSSIAEFVALVLKRRAKMLEKGLARLLGTDECRRLYEQPLIRSLMERDGKKPSYIDAASFATAFFGSVAGLSPYDLMAALMPADSAAQQLRVEAITGFADGSGKRACATACRTDLAREELARVLADADVVPAELAGALLGRPTPADGLGTPAAIDAAIDAIDANLNPSYAAELHHWLVDGWATAGRNPTALVNRIRTVDPLIDTQFPAIQTIQNEQLRKALEGLARRAVSAGTTLRHEVEDWYDRQMQRVSGWYAKRTQWIMAAIGLLVAVGFNVSAITVGRALWTDSVLRERLVNEATSLVTTTTTPTSSTTATTATNPSTTTTTTAGVKPPTYQDLKDLGLPIGWNREAVPAPGWIDWLLHSLGWLGVAVAASFGAPFWFDALNRLVNLRASGPKPDTAADQRKAAAAAGTS